jgi:hypothetical protein
LIALIAGVGFAVLGIAAVARTGFDTSHIYTPRVVLWRLPHNPLLAVIEIGYGALLIISAVVPGGMRAFMGLLGSAALVFGIVILAGPTPHRLTHWLGVNHSNGLFFTIVGAVVVVSAIVSPVFFGGARRRRIRSVRSFA